MKRILTLIFIFLLSNSAICQISKNVYPLNEMDSLLTKDVKTILHEKLIDKKYVFLGESYHLMGSDFLAKTQFIKYLVLEEGYTDIAFESDFFALYFNHDKENLYSFWRNSLQCKELFEFLKEHHVTIWGFDNQMQTTYSNQNFTKKLSDFLTKNSVTTSNDFYNYSDNFIKNPLKFENRNQLLSEIDKLLRENKVTDDLFWKTTLESFKSYVIEIDKWTKKNKDEASEVRDNQMAKNLNFLVKSMPDKKFIVWLHNAHMTKDTYTFVPGQNMGGEFVKLNSNTSFHIAFSAINTIFRDSKKIEKDSKDENNLLHFLPSTTGNYFLDSEAILKNNPDYKNKEFDGLFDLTSKKTKTNWLGHYDALIFIAKGELIAN